MRSSRKPRAEATTSKGAQTRDDILRLTSDLASAEGLEGLTIGRVAREMEMSKSGVFAHFGSKEDLQLATIEHARDVFVRHIIDPHERLEPGLDRLRAYLESWLTYVEESVFRGGCFFAAASLEFDGRRGAVRDRLQQLTGQWLEILTSEIEAGIESGEIAAAERAGQLAFELHAFVQEANWASQLLERNDAFHLARKAIQNRLERCKEDNPSRI